MYLDPSFEGHNYIEKALFQDTDIYNVSFSQFSIKKVLKYFGDESLKDFKKEQKKFNLRNTFIQV